MDKERNACWLREDQGLTEIESQKSLSSKGQHFTTQRFGVEGGLAERVTLKVEDVCHDRDTICSGGRVCSFGTSLRTRSGQ